MPVREDCEGKQIREALSSFKSKESYTDVLINYRCCLAMDQEWHNGRIMIQHYYLQHEGVVSKLQPAGVKGKPT